MSRTLQLAIQAALDTASHVVSDRRLGEPETDRQLFELLRDELNLPAALSENLQKMAGFRNLLVHGYQTVHRRILRRVVEDNLDDLLTYVELVRSRFMS